MERTHSNDAAFLGKKLHKTTIHLMLYKAPIDYLAWRVSRAPDIASASASLRRRQRGKTCKLGSTGGMRLLLQKCRS